MSASRTDGQFLGIDIGSVSMSYVLIDRDKAILKSGYLFHHGNIYGLLRETLEGLDLSLVQQVVYNHKAGDFFTAGVSVNEQVALIEGALFQQRDIGSMFVIGGETFGDIGSTSTKAVVTTAGGEDRILFGLYTRTFGQPIRATQSLLAVLREIEEQHGIQFAFCGVGTTGSGRKFMQKVLNADLAADEITAHARAAYALNPRVDTVIEIGGQDAKFTVMENGQVTFSVMNYVCAAGTGSFIEELAKRLDVTLDDYAERAMGTPSPLTSDRCTVFMERDLNHYLSLGYAKEELLAAALHSVTDNYLSKVARSSIFPDPPSIMCSRSMRASPGNCASSRPRARSRRPITMPGTGSRRGRDCSPKFISNSGRRPGTLAWFFWGGRM